MLEIDGIKLYTRAELASMLNAGEATIANYQKNGELRSVKIGRRIYSSEESLREFLNGRMPIPGEERTRRSRG